MQDHDAARGRQVQGALPEPQKNSTQRTYFVAKVVLDDAAEDVKREVAGERRHVRS
jgi:hypothetical protein